MIEDKSPQRTPVENLGEFGLIDFITKNFEIEQDSTITGIGDDAAVLNHTKSTVVTRQLTSCMKVFTWLVKPMELTL